MILDWHLELHAERVIEVPLRETKISVFLFSNMFFESTGDLYVGYHAEQLEREADLRFTELSNLKPIPLTTFRSYDMAVSSTGFEAIPSDAFLKRPRSLPFFANKSLISKSILQELHAYTCKNCVPHPNLVSRVGCLMNESCVVGFLTKRYEFSVLETIDKSRKL